MSSQKHLKELGFEWSPPEDPLAAVWRSGSCRGAVRPLASDPHRSSPKFTTSSRYHGYKTKPLAFHTSASSALTTVNGAEEKGYEKMHPLMSQWLRTFAHPLLSAGKAKPAHPVQAMQDYFSTHWTLLHFSWTGGSPALHSMWGPPGRSQSSSLPWTSLSLICDSQGAEKCNRPGPMPHSAAREACNLPPLPLRLAKTSADARALPLSHTPTTFFPKRQGPRPKIALDPAPPASS